MSDKLPQPTDTLIKRLRRVAKHLELEAELRPFLSRQDRAKLRARMNTCWQAAARLEELHQFHQGFMQS